MFVNYIIYCDFFAVIYSRADASILLNGSCQSIPVPMSSSEASITTAQSVPTHLIQSDQTYAMQKNSNQADITALTPEKGNVFFRNSFNKKK